MKICKKIFIFITVLASLCLFAPSISASQTVDINKNSDLTINYNDNNTALSNTEFNLYLFAECDNRYNFLLTENFKNSNIKIPENEKEFQETASKLENYILENSINPYSKGVTDLNGLCKISNLKSGMYLIIGKDTTVGDKIYRTKPFIATLPFFDYQKNQWIYELNVSPKFESKPIDSSDEIIPPSPKPSTPQKPSSGKLPQTGQPWSLALTLAFIGLCFVTFGLYLNRRTKNEK